MPQFGLRPTNGRAYQDPYPERAVHIRLAEFTSFPNLGWAGCTRAYRPVRMRPGVGDISSGTGARRPQHVACEIPDHEVIRFRLLGREPLSESSRNLELRRRQVPPPIARGTVRRAGRRCRPGRRLRQSRRPESPGQHLDGSPQLRIELLPASP